MKIGDLWVKLGLKKDEFDKGMKEAGDQVSGGSGGGLLGKLKNLKVSSVAIWGAIAAGAVAMADKFAHTSQRLGDQWDQTMAGLKGSWKSFISAVNSTDFSGLGKRMEDAFSSAKKVAAMKDAEFEVMNSINIRKSAIQEELSLLEIEARNQKKSQQERITAAENYLAKIKPLYDEEAKYREKYADALKEDFLASSGMSVSASDKEYLETFLTQVANKSPLLDALESYSNYATKTGSGIYTREQQRLVEDFMSQFAGDYHAWGAFPTLAREYKSKNDEDVKPLIDAIVSENASRAAFNEETRRLHSIANQAVTMGGGGSDSGLSSFDMAIIRAAERMQDVLDDTMDDMQDEVEDMNGSVEFDPIKIVPPDMKEWDEFYTKYQDDLQRMQDLLTDFRDAAIGGLSDAVQELADQFAGLNEINPGKVVQALLTPLADMAIKEGEILIAQGIGVEACKKALEQLNGIPAIAAGTALIAIGAAAKSGLAALAQAGAGSTATTSYSGAGASAAQTQTISTEMTVYVTGRLSGSDILLSGQKTQNAWNR